MLGMTVCVDISIPAILQEITPLPNRVQLSYLYFPLNIWKGGFPVKRDSKTCALGIHRPALTFSSLYGGHQVVQIGCEAQLVGALHISEYGLGYWINISI